MQNLVDYIGKGASILRPQDKESGSAKLAKEETSSTTAMSQWAYGTFKQLSPDKWQNIKSLLAPQVNPAKPLYFSGPGWTAGVFAKSPQIGPAFKLLQYIGDVHGSDLFDSGIVTPVAGRTRQVPWPQEAARCGRLDEALEGSGAEDQPGGRTAHRGAALRGVSASIRDDRIQQGRHQVELDKWNKDVQEALSGL